jgi:tetratricopeptide (TPR) repeat protein
MFALKTISVDAIPEALAKAERYRLLNEPGEAESICQDVLSVDPSNQQALITLLLAVTDQFTERIETAKAAEVTARLQGSYERAYYSGIVCERQGRAQFGRNHYGSSAITYDCLTQAMRWYEQAEALRPPNNDDALLRWNTCARFLMAHPKVQPEPQVPAEPILSE